MSDSPLYRVISTTSILTNDSIEDAESIFEQFKHKRVIRNDCSFEDDEWHLTDEYENRGLYFDFSIGTYNKWYKEIFNMELADFVLYVKAFLCVLLGKKCLSYLAQFLLDIKHLVKTPAPSLCEAFNKVTFINTNLVSDFLKLLPDAAEKREEFLEEFDNMSRAAYGHGNQRELADYMSYFKFDRILTEYWNSELSDSDRRFFFPLYVWWKVTAVIPLRPRELLLTPRDCIYQDGDMYYLRLRKNMLKGNLELKDVTYTIDGDYVVCPIHIPDELAFELINYINMTSDYDATDLYTLFVTDPHYDFFGQAKNRRSRFLTYTNMSTILRQFYKTVISDIYGYSVIYDRDPSVLLADDEISYIHLGDTRHLSMINLVAEGASPTAAMILAGHASIYTSEHYYTNIREYISCKAHDEYLRLTQNNKVMAIAPRGKASRITEGIPVKSGGLCFSPAYKGQSYEDCISAVGPNGELAYCKACAYHRDEHGKSFYTDDSVYLRNLEDDCKELERAIRTVHSKLGEVEEICQAVLKVQASAKEYEDYKLTKELFNGGETNGKEAHNKR